MKTRIPFALASTLLGLAALTVRVSAHAEPTIINIPDPKSSEWTKIVLRQEGAATVTAATDNGEDPSTPFYSELGHWNILFSLPDSFVVGTIMPERTSSDTLALIYDQFTWDPAQRGGIDVIELSAELGREVSTFASGVAGFVRPVVMQAGAVYSVLGSDIAVDTAFKKIGLDPIFARPIFPTAHWSLAASDNWVQTDGTTTGLDLSAAGAPIRFGVRWGLATDCLSKSGCSGAATLTQIDELKFSIQSVSSVPEAETYAMMLAGLGLIGAIARRRRAIRA